MWHSSHQIWIQLIPNWRSCGREMAFVSPDMEPVDTQLEKLRKRCGIPLTRCPGWAGPGRAGPSGRFPVRAGRQPNEHQRGPRRAPTRAATLPKAPLQVEKVNSRQDQNLRRKGSTNAAEQEKEEVRINPELCVKNHMRRMDNAPSGNTD